VATRPAARQWARIGQIAAPVLAVSGALDSVDHLQLAERFARGVQHGRVASVPDSAHYPNMEHPAEFNALVLEFLSSLATPTESTPTPAAWT
jgi:pimeloyl-ACP methyl ester carboxylesterase